MFSQTEKMLDNQKNCHMYFFLHSKASQNIILLIVFILHTYLQLKLQLTIMTIFRKMYFIKFKIFGNNMKFYASFFIFVIISSDIFFFLLALIA